MVDLCDWPVDYAACGATVGDPEAVPPVPASTGCPALDDLGADERAAFEHMAGELLWNWTNRVFGLCEVTVRPCRSDCGSFGAWSSTFWGRGPYPWGSSAGAWSPVPIGGEWFNLGCGCAGTCACSEDGPTALQLPGPVATVARVRVDGVELAPSAYEVMYGRTLVRRDGGVWPACQDLLAPADTVGTFEIVYTRGVPVPTGGQVAAGVLACELAKAACGDDSCQLPQRIQTVTRQGVTVGFVDSFQGLDDARTGIWLIDSWTSSFRRTRPMAGIRSPDYRGPRRG